MGNLSSFSSYFSHFLLNVIVSLIICFLFLFCLQFVHTTMPPLVVWCGRRTLWRTAAERAASHPVCHFAPSVSRRATIRGTILICSWVRQGERAIVGTVQLWRRQGETKIPIVIVVMGVIVFCCLFVLGFVIGMVQINRWIRGRHPLILCVSLKRWCLE